MVGGIQNPNSKCRCIGATPFGARSEFGNNLGKVCAFHNKDEDNKGRRKNEPWCFVSKDCIEAELASDNSFQSETSDYLKFTDANKCGTGEDADCYRAPCDQLTRVNQVCALHTLHATRRCRVYAYSLRCPSVQVGAT